MFVDIFCLHSERFLLALFLNTRTIGNILPMRGLILINDVFGDIFCLHSDRIFIDLFLNTRTIGNNLPMRRPILINQTKFT